MKKSSNQKGIKLIKKKLSSIRFQIVMYSMGFAILVSALLVSICYFYIRANLRRNVRETSESSLQLLGSEIDKSLDNAENFALWTTIDSTINTYLYRMTQEAKEADTLDAEKLKERNAVDRRLALSTWEHFNNEYNAMGRTRHIQRVIVSTVDGQHYLQSIQNAAITSSQGLIGRIMSTNYFYHLLEAEDFEFYGLKNSPANPFLTEPVIPMVRPIQSSSSSEEIGFVYMEVSPTIITSVFSNYILESDERVFISIGRGHKYEFKDGALSECSTLPDDMVSYQFKNKAFTLYILPSRRAMDIKMNYYLAIIGLIGFSIIFIGLLLWLRLDHVISDPITKLLYKLEKIGGGDFSRDESIEWDTELGAIGAGINALSQNVENLMEKKVQDEKKKQELEYQILQSQINPHFLYNTLNTIKWMATIQGSDGIADMSTALSRLLRNISKSKENVIPLSKELDLVKDYFTIMKYRYGGTIEFDIDIKDPVLLRAGVNRFSLQPIIENAIFHGIEPKGGAGKIVVSVFLKEQGDGTGIETQERKLMIIEVRDDGIGMTQEQIEKTLSGELEGADDFFRHIGVANVSQRIKYTFGEEYGLSIESEVSKYTVMRFTLPYIEAE
ncbi:sensor histidine kinase [Oribacterium sp. WCC10]|uniref:sensor histidine kinase n=1 Tax=Oribacterium sp. WCC10 TaxID=1855343 RepID=UPI001587D80C|nr:sensor histidine kinase [Oribacterium sp. WCC10]